MDSQALMKLAIAGAATFAVYKFAPSAAVKAAALGVLGVMVARQVPYVNAALG